MAVSRQITLAARPHGFPSDGDFKLVEKALDEPNDGEFQVRCLYLSVDPYMRGRMNDSKSYAEPVAIGDVMVGECVAVVEQSRHTKFPEGTYVSGMFGWQTHALSDGQAVRRLRDDLPLTTALHILGMPGMTAYFGLHDVCQPESGNTVLVSGAAGAVGGVVGQLAKAHGCRVVGIAGSDEKIDYLVNELGFDAGINYKQTEDYLSAYRKHCPDGIDAYFDNVGGPITDAVFPCLNIGSRIAICGQISQYNLEQAEQGPRLLWHTIIKRCTIQGFLVMDYFDRFREALTALGGLYAEGKLKYRERITQGLESAPQAFVEMMQGANIGKQLVQISEP